MTRILCILMAVILPVSALVGCGSAEQSSVTQPAGDYVNKADPDDHLVIHRDGSWAFWSRGTTPRFHNTYTGDLTAADDSFKVFGPSGAMTTTTHGSLVTLEFEVTNESMEAFLQDFLKQVGCPDVSRVRYQGALDPAVGHMLEAKFETVAGTAVCVFQSPGTASGELIYAFEKAVD